MNSRYKVFTKQWLLDNNVDLIIDGQSTRNIDTKQLKKDFWNYKTLEVQQYSNKYKKWYPRKPISNTKIHSKGIKKKCTYYQIGISRRKQTTIGIPLHRIVYVWFNDIILPYNENEEKMEICHNIRVPNDIILDNHIKNLRWDTAKQNRAERDGAINQYGRKKNDKAD